MASETRTRMIETTARLVQARGFHGVSLSDILAESGAPRGSLYFHFPGGKNALVLEAITASVEQATTILKDCLDRAGRPEDGVRAFFEAAAGEMAASDFTFGCPVAPVILDSPGLDPELGRACREAMEEWEGLYHDALTAAGFPPRRAAGLARTVLASLEGALIMARSQRDAGVIREVGEEMADLLAGATGT